MDVQATYNEFGSREKFYRFQSENSATTYDPHFGFLAGDYDDADYFPSLDYDEQLSIVEDHSDWSCPNASPFISTTSDLEWALRVAKTIRSIDPVYIAEISPGRAVSGSIRYYHWDELVRELDADIERKATNDHETVFLGQIPQEAITWYGTVEEAEGHDFEDEEEDEDFEQEEEEYEEDNEESEEFPNFLLSLISRLKMGSDEQEGEEETEEANLWYNHLLEADLVDDPDYEQSSCEEEDFDLQSEDDSYDLLQW